MTQIRRRVASRVDPFDNRPFSFLPAHPAREPREEANIPEFTVALALGGSVPQHRQHLLSKGGSVERLDLSPDIGPLFVERAHPLVSRGFCRSGITEPTLGQRSAGLRSEGSFGGIVLAEDRRLVFDEDDVLGSLDWTERAKLTLHWSETSKDSDAFFK